MTRDFNTLHDYGDFSNALHVIVQERDTNSWEAGDVLKLFEFKVGRPNRDNPDALTLHDLAADCGASAARLSEWRNVASFYPRRLRTYSVSWEIYNQARRSSKGNRDNALELLDLAERQHMSVAAFRRYLKGIVWEGPVTKAGLPLWLVQKVAGYENEFWLILKRREGDG